MSRSLFSLLVTGWLVAGCFPLLLPSTSEGAPNPEVGGYLDESFGRFEWYNPFPSGNVLRSCAWSPDGAEALIVGENGALISYDGLKLTQLHSNSKLTFTDVAWHPTGDHALITASGGKLLKYEEGALTEVPTGTTVQLRSLDFDSNTGMGIIVGAERTVLLYDGVKVTTVSSGGNVDLTSASWEPTGAYALVTGANLFRYESGTASFKTLLVANGTDRYNSVSFSPTGELALVTSYDVRTGGSRGWFWNGTALEEAYRDPTTSYLSTAWSPGGRHGYMLGGSALVELSPDGSNRTYPPAGWMTLRAMSWRPDGSGALLVGSSDTNGGYVGTFDGASTFRLSKHAFGDFMTSTLNAVAWSPDGETAVLATDGGWIVVLGKGGYRNLFVRVKGAFPDFNGVAWHPDGTYALVVGSAGSIVRVYPDGSYDGNLQSNTVQAFRAVAWAPDGSYALLVGDGGTVRRYDGLKTTPVPSETQMTLRSVAFRPNDSTGFIVGGDIRTVPTPTGQVQQSWQVLLQYNGRIITTNRVQQQGSVFNSISFSPGLIAADGGEVVLIEDYGPFKYYELPDRSNLLSATWIQAYQDALLLGEGGSAAIFNQTRRELRPLNASTIQPFTAASVRPIGEEVFCVGWNAMIMKYQPNAPPTPVVLAEPSEVTDNSLRLAWSPNPDGDFEHLEVLQTNLLNFSGQKVVLSTRDQSRTGMLISGLTRQTTYYYKVRVWDNAGLMADSNAVKATTLLGNIPPVAVKLSAPTAMTDSSMTLKWTANGDGDFDRYEVHRSTTKGFTPLPGTRMASLKDQEVTEYHATGLSQSTNYYFKVRTVDLGSLHNDSNEVNATTEATNVPPAAVDLSDPSAIQESSMKLTWTPNADSDFARYELYRGMEASFNLTSGSLLATILNQSSGCYTAEDLATNTTYYFRMRTLDAAGLHNDSREVRGTTLPPNTPPSPVTLLEPVEVGETSVTLEWTETAEPDFLRYELHAGTEPGFAITSQTAKATLVEAGQTSYTVVDLAPETRHYFKVRVFDGKQLFADSNEVSALTLPNQAPQAVALYWPVNITENSMVLEWSVSPERDFDRYELHAGTESGFSPSVDNLKGQLTSNQSVVYNVTGLEANTTYYFKVRVFDSGQLAADSNEVNGRTLGPDLPPGAPVLADPDEVTETTVYLEWTENRDPDFAKFKVHRSTAASFQPSAQTEVTSFTSPKTTKYNVSGLKPNTPFFFKIEVVDLAGKTNLSNEVRARTLTVNIPPVASAGEPQTVLVNTLVFLSGSAYDQDGYVNKYEWDFQGDGFWDVNQANGNASHTYENLGVFEAKLRVTDNRGGFGEASVNVTVVPPVPPDILPVVLDTGEDVLAYVGEEVFFPANATDPDGYIVTYQWDFEGDGIYDYTSTADANTTHVYNTAGLYGAALKVTDDRGGFTIVYRNVEIVRFNSPPVATIDSPRNGQKYYLEELITLTGSGSYDPDGDRISHLWESTDDAKVLGKSANVKITLARGNYTVRLTVSDGELADQKEVKISVIERPNVLPTVKIDTPTSNSIIKGTLVVAGSAKDEKKVEKVEVRLDPSGSWQKATGTRSWSYEIETSGLANGPHTVYARAHDGQDYSAEISVKIAIDNPAPKKAEPKAAIPGFGPDLALGALAGAAVLGLLLRSRGDPPIQERPARRTRQP